MCKCRSAPKFVKICVHVMLVSAKECRALRLHELFDLRCEFLVLPQSKSPANVVHIAVPVRLLLMCQVDEALDKLSTQYHNGSTGFVLTDIGLITVMSEYGIQPSTKQSHPRLLMLTENILSLA